MEFVFSLAVGRKYLNTISDNMLNTDKILKFVGALTIAHHTCNYFGWDKQYLFYLMRKIPYVRDKIYQKKIEIRGKIKNDLNSPIKNMNLNLQLPVKGLSESEILKEIRRNSEIGW